MLDFEHAFGPHTYAADRRLLTTPPVRSIRSIRGKVHATVRGKNHSGGGGAWEGQSHPVRGVCLRRGQVRGAGDR